MGGTMMAGSMIAHPVSALFMYAWKPDPLSGDVQEEAARSAAVESK